MNTQGCPVVTSDFESIRLYLAGLPLDELIFLTEQIFGTLSSTEKINYDLNHYCTAYSDVQGRIDFIRALFDNGIISPLQIPFSHQRDSRLSNLLRTKDMNISFRLPRE